MDFISQIINEVVESVVEERWLPIVGYEGKYEVSDLGRVKSFTKCKDGKILVGDNIKKGYIQVTLCKKKVINRYLIHRLVLQTFLPTEEDLECDHINHIKNDNRLVNLRWVSHSQNNRYRLKRDGCSSQYLGVYKNNGRGKHWKATCKIDGENIHLGYFDTEEEGAKAYNDFVISKDLQDFTHLNEIN